MAWSSSAAGLRTGDAAACAARAISASARRSVQLSTALSSLYTMRQCD